VSTYEITGDVDGAVAPALLVAFADWVNAGDAATTAAQHIADEGEVVVRFDPDVLFDYRDHRPVLDIINGRPAQFQWPELTIVRRRLPEREVFVMTGAEPDLRWQEFAADVLELSLRIGIIEHVSIGAIPAAVPHTAPTQVMMTSAKEEDGTGGPEGLLRVPAAAVSAVEWTMAQNGIPAVGFWAQVPHYAAPYAGGAIALVRRVESHLSVTIGAGELEEEDARQRVALQEIMEGNPEAQAYLERLQSMAGEQEIPPAENIGEEVERFLRNRRPGGGPPSPFSPS
jgi:hypothetical protein